VRSEGWTRQRGTGTADSDSREPTWRITLKEPHISEEGAGLNWQKVSIANEYLSMKLMKGVMMPRMRDARPAEEAWESTWISWRTPCIFEKL